jgi:hypothetical protein
MHALGERLLIVNCGSKLSKRYFKSYIQLHINAFECTIEEAKDRVYHHLFKRNEQMYGSEAFANFITAFEEMRENAHEDTITIAK